MEVAGLNVLVVDDSELIVSRVLDILSEMPFVKSCYPAYNYQEAINLLQYQNIDYALLDINLPDRNGIELLSYITESFPHIKSIMLTNQSDIYYRNLCNTIGAYFFLDKSTEFEKVAELLQP